MVWSLALAKLALKSRVWRNLTESAQQRLLRARESGQAARQHSGKCGLLRTSAGTLRQTRLAAGQRKSTGSQSSVSLLDPPPSRTPSFASPVRVCRQFAICKLPGCSCFPVAARDATTGGACSPPAATSEYAQDHHAVVLSALCRFAWHKRFAATCCRCPLAALALPPLLQFRAGLLCFLGCLLGCVEPPLASCCTGVP